MTAAPLRLSVWKKVCTINVPSKIIIIVSRNRTKYVYNTRTIRLHVYTFIYINIVVIDNLFAVPALWCFFAPVQYGGRGQYDVRYI